MGFVDTEIPNLLPCQPRTLGRVNTQLNFCCALESVLKIFISAFAESTVKSNKICQTFKHNKTSNYFKNLCVGLKTRNNSIKQQGGGVLENRAECRQRFLDGLRSSPTHRWPQETLSAAHNHSLCQGKHSHSHVAGKTAAAHEFEMRNRNHRGSTSEQRAFSCLFEIHSCEAFCSDLARRALEKTSPRRKPTGREGRLNVMNC